MSSYSIDFLTRDIAKKSDYDSESSTNGISPSIMDVSSSQSDSDQSCGENTGSIAEVLLSLDKTIKHGLIEDQSNDKPPHSYIALISMAILSTKEKKMLLSDIYQYIMDKFKYYNNLDKAWRNSIRHNLSLNECFVKNGRSDNGKGNYWSIHPACVDDFARGDFRRRQARRRARKGIQDFSSQQGNSDANGINCRYNLGYVPMASSSVGYHTFAHQMYLPSSTYGCTTGTLPTSVSPGFYPTPGVHHTRQPTVPSLLPCRFQDSDKKYGLISL